MRRIRGEKREETEAFPSLVSPFSFPRQFFARALLSDRMEQAVMREWHARERGAGKKGELSVSSAARSRVLSRPVRFARHSK